MATQLKPVGHEDRLSIVEHLDELRTRIIICVAQLRRRRGHLPVAGRPDPRDRQPAARRGAVRQAVRRDPRPARAGRLLAAGAEAGQPAARATAKRARRPTEGTEPELRDQPRQLARAADGRGGGDAARRPPRRPVTLGVGEPLTATLTVAGYAALLITLPLLLYQLYAFVLPAFSPREREVALPLMVLVPFLFYTGVVFAYYVVLPRGGQLPPELQRRQLRRAPAGAGLLQVLDHGPGGDGGAVPDADRDPRDHADGDPDPEAAAAEPPLRDPGHSHRRRPAARRRPGDDAPDHAPDRRALRGLYPSRLAARPARRAPRRRRGGRGGRAATSPPWTTRCSSTSEAPAAAAPSRSCTSRSPSSWAGA